MKVTFRCLLLLCTVTASVSHAQSHLGKVTAVDNEPLASVVVPSRSKPVDNEPAIRVSTQRLVCDRGYTQKLCGEQMAVLKKALERYSVTKIGDWTWVLVRSQDWNAIVVPRGIDSDTPAFSYPAKHETFIEEALVSLVPERHRTLLLKWGMGHSQLLDFAIRHELGHALCNDPSERNADRVSRLIQSGAAVLCDVGDGSARR